MPPAQLFDRHAGLGLTQKADDLFFGKAFLHVQSPCCRGLDSRSLRYSKQGERRPQCLKQDPTGHDTYPDIGTLPLVWNSRTVSRLGWVLAEPRYLRAAEATLRAGLESLHQTPHARAGLALALQEFLHPPVIVVLRDHPQRYGTGIDNSKQNAPWISSCWPIALSDKPAIWPVCAHVCQGTHCEPPLTVLPVLMKRLSEGSAYNGMRILTVNERDEAFHGDD
jgi:hypothetical protein